MQRNHTDDIPMADRRISSVSWWADKRVGSTSMIASMITVMIDGDLR
jgi:hypothetical protein